MLKILRKKGVAKKFLWALAIIIILSFGFFGSAYLITNLGQARTAGEIFGQKISPDDFERVYQQSKTQAIMTKGEKFLKSPDSVNLIAETWDRLILMHEAKKRKIKINDEAVIKEIENLPFFQRDGHFDTLLYNDILRHIFRIQPREFEEGIRNNLIISQLYVQETLGVNISEEEVWDIYKEQNEKSQISYVFINFDMFKNEVVLSDEETLPYFDNNKEQFRIPRTVNVNYIHLDFPANAKETKGADKEAVKQLAKTIYQDLSAQSSISAVAQKNNVEVKASGFFSKEQPNLSLGWSYDALNKIFGMKENDVLAPLTTETGINIIQMNKKRESYLPEYAEVKDKVVETVKNLKAKDIARQKSEEYLEEIKQEYEKSKLEDFAAAAKKLNLPIQQTPVFIRGQYLPKIGISKEFQETAFGLTDQNKISGIVETAKGFCILHRDNYTPADKDNFEKNKEELGRILFNLKRNEAFTDYVSKLRLQAQLQDNVSR